MIDLTEMERAAMQACLKPLGEAVARLGLDQPLADYSRDEVLHVIEVVITAYQNYMVAEHERLADRERAYFEAPQAQRKRTAPPTGERAG